jgi:hypothetical protein
VFLAMMEKMVSLQEATEKSLQKLHHQVNELKKQTPQSKVFLSCRHGSHLAIEPALLTSYNVGQCDLYLHNYNIGMCLVWSFGYSVVFVS